jgi:photosystem II stability/assembly factor-like uncharacterized protein
VDGGLIWKPLPIRLVATKAVAPEKAAPASRKTTRAKAATRRTVARKPIETLHQIMPHEIAGVYAVKNGASDLIFAATDLGLVKSADGGLRWTMAEVAGSAPVTGLFLSVNSDGRLVARTDAGLFLTKDFGEHWNTMNFPSLASDVKDVAVPADPDTAILVATRSGLYASKDDGAHWQSNAGGLPASTVNSVAYGSGTLAFAVQYGKLWESKDGGSTWSPQASELPLAHIRKLWVPDLATNRLLGITSDLGVLYRN